MCNPLQVIYLLVTQPFNSSAAAHTDNTQCLIATRGLQETVERILHFEGFFFSNTSLEMSVIDGSGFQDDSYPSVAWKSLARDPLCCNSTRTEQPFFSAGQDFMLVSGVYQPLIALRVRPHPGEHGKLAPFHALSSARSLKG